MLTLYGLKTCDACRTARKQLDAAGVAHRFVDLREDAGMAVLAPRWIAALGAGVLVNRKSTTWRGLSEAERARAETPEGAAALLCAHPTLAKRPVIESEGRVLAGWTPEIRQALGA